MTDDIHDQQTCGSKRDIARRYIDNALRQFDFIREEHESLFSQLNDALASLRNPVHHVSEENMSAINQQGWALERALLSADQAVNGLLCPADKDSEASNGI